MKPQRVSNPNNAPSTNEAIGLSSTTFGRLGRIALKDKSIQENNDINPDVSYEQNIPTEQDVDHTNTLNNSSPNDSDNFAKNEALAKDFYDRNGQVIRYFAKDNSIGIRLAEKDETFSFLPAHNTIVAPVSWFTPNQKYNEAELVFGNEHEVGHFLDMRKNPDAFLKNFDYMEDKAESLASEYLRKHPNTSSKEKAKQYYYTQLHTLYNVLDDIYVNNLVIKRNPKFEEPNGQRDIINLYKKLGFDQADLTEQPLHLQMAYSLLMEKMLGDEIGTITVDPRVKQILNKNISPTKNRTLHDVVLSDLIEFGADEPGDIRKDLKDPAKRYRRIRMKIEPLYLSLLKAQIEDQIEEHSKNDNNEQKGENTNSEQKDSSKQEGEDINSGQKDNKEQQGKEGGNSYDPFDDTKNSGTYRSILDHDDDEDHTIKDILNNIKTSNGLSDEERKALREQKDAEKFDKENGISPEQRAINNAMLSEIRSTRLEMAKFWDKLIGKSVNYAPIIRRGQKKGEINIEDVKDNYTEIVKAERNGGLKDVKIYENKSMERNIVDQPERIEITLLIDCSGSMDQGKIKVARQTATLLMYSVKDFNKKLNNTRKFTHSKLYADVEVTLFGSAPETVKPFSKTRNPSDTQDDAKTIASISKIDNNKGWTNDTTPILDIIKNLSKQDKSKIKSKKLKKIVFEITDGVPDHSTGTSIALKELANEGVIVVGFQIGEVSNGEKKLFEDIWNTNNASDNKKGIYIGENISKLPTRLMDTLSEQLGNIVI